MRFVRSVKDNGKVIGNAPDLNEFLFGSKRSDLSVYRKILAPIQGRRCFYCAGNLSGDAAVDHFVPWSRYQVDLGHNFVLAHGAKCNGNKADRLAAFQHLERWCERNERRGADLAEEFARAKVVADLGISNRITQWAYEQVSASHGLVWVKGQTLEPLDPGWRRLPGMAA